MEQTIKIGDMEFNIDEETSKLAEVQNTLQQMAQKLGLTEIRARVEIGNKFIEVMPLKANYANAPGNLVIQQGLTYVFGVIGGPFDKDGAHYPG